MADTHAAVQDAPQTNALGQFLNTFEDEHHHPKNGLLWFVLLVFTLLEVIVAAVIPLPPLKAGELKDANELCRRIVEEARVDEQALARRHEAKRSDATYKPDQLALTNRPGRRILSLLTAPERAKIQAWARATKPLSEAEKTELAALLQTNVIENLAFYQRDSFSALDPSPAVVEKIAKAREGGSTHQIMSFLGEANIKNLNRGLLELAYEGTITSPPISRALIIGLVLAALIKAAFVAIFFMHARYEGTWLKILTVPSLTLAFVVVVFLAPDIGLVDKGEWAYKFLLPMALLIFAAFALVLFLTRSADMPKMDPDPHH